MSTRGGDATVEAAPGARGSVAATGPGWGRDERSMGSHGAGLEAVGLSRA